MKTDQPKTEVRDRLDAATRASGSETHLHQAFDIGRLDNEIEPPKLLLDIVHIGVAIWGLLLAAGVYLFGGGDWREALLVIGVFAFFLGAWRLAMALGARKKAGRERRENASADTRRDAVRRLSRATERADETEAPVDPHAETRGVDSAIESTVAASGYVRR